MDRYTRYYANQSEGGWEVGSVYLGSFRAQRGHGIGSFFRGLFRFVKLLLFSGAEAVGKEALKTGSNIITDILSNESEQPVGAIFKNRFHQAKGNLEQKIENMTGSGLSLKRKRKSKRAQLKTKRSKVNDFFLHRSTNGKFKVRSRHSSNGVYKHTS
jgi:hypothetical protein